MFIHIHYCVCALNSILEQTTKKNTRCENAYTHTRTHTEAAAHTYAQREQLNAPKWDQPADENGNANSLF